MLGPDWSQQAHKQMAVEEELPVNVQLPAAIINGSNVRCSDYDETWTLD